MYKDRDLLSSSVLGLVCTSVRVPVVCEFYRFPDNVYGNYNLMPVSNGYAERHHLAGYNRLVCNRRQGEERLYKDQILFLPCGGNRTQAA